MPIGCLPLKRSFRSRLTPGIGSSRLCKAINHIVKIKERDDDTPFDKIDPAIEQKDKTYKKGSLGGLGTDPGSTWVDNFIVYEDPKDILAVDSNGKLAVTWGKLKGE